MSQIDLITDPSIAVVSFDIFDTLIQRATAAPTDIFACLEPLVDETTRGTFQNFQQVRPVLAKMAKAKRGQPRQECTLAEIYGLLTEWQLIRPEQAEALMAAEIEAEKAVLMRREEGCRLFEAAKAAGKRVILMSDMYLPLEAVEDIIRALDLSGYAALYLSSEHRGQKYYGELWDIMLAKEGVNPAGVIHIGDNPISDHKKPQARGLRTLLLPKATEVFKTHPVNKRLYDKGFPDSAFPDASLFPSIAMGLECARFYADTARPVNCRSRFGGQPFQLGYAALGPAVAGFVLWLARQAEKDRISDLFFLSRDGAIMHQVFQVLGGALAPEVRGHYLYNSRKVILTSNISNVSDIMGLCLSYFKPVTVERFLIDKFGLAKADIPAGLPLDEEVSMDDRDLIMSLGLKLSPLIYERSARKKAALRAYLEEAAFISGRPKAVVDIGFSGAIQAGLADFSPESPLGGYYFFSDHRIARAARHWPVQAFFEGLIDKFSNQFTHKYVCHYFETLFKRAEEGSLEEVEFDGNGAPSLVFRQTTGDCNQRVLPLIQTGALAFAEDLVRHFGPWLKQMPLNPYSVCQAYLQFWESPTEVDARILEGFVIDDSFGGLARQYAIAPAGQGESFWPEGAAALGRGPS